MSLGDEPNHPRQCPEGPPATALDQWVQANARHLKLALQEVHDLERSDLDPAWHRAPVCEPMQRLARAAVYLIDEWVHPTVLDVTARAYATLAIHWLASDPQSTPETVGEPASEFPLDDGKYPDVRQSGPARMMPVPEAEEKKDEKKGKKKQVRDFDCEADDEMQWHAALGGLGRDYRLIVPEIDLVGPPLMDRPPQWNSWVKRAKQACEDYAELRLEHWHRVRKAMATRQQLGAWLCGMRERGPGSERWLRCVAEAWRNAQAGGTDVKDQRCDANLPALSTHETSILSYLLERPHVAKATEDIMAGIDRKATTVKGALRRLRETGLIKRPDGSQRKGHVLTPEGIRVAELLR